MFDDDGDDYPGGLDTEGRVELVNMLAEVVGTEVTHFANENDVDVDHGDVGQALLLLAQRCFAADHPYLSSSEAWRSLGNVALKQAVIVALHDGEIEPAGTA
jgi:hypothetical protein